MDIEVIYPRRIKRCPESQRIVTAMIADVKAMGGKDCEAGARAAALFAARQQDKWDILRHATIH